MDEIFAFLEYIEMVPRQGRDYWMRYTKYLAQSFPGKWIISKRGPEYRNILKAVSFTTQGHRTKAIPFGFYIEVEVRTRKFRLATDEEIAIRVARRVVKSDQDSNQPF